MKMPAQWLVLSAKFAALAPREKWLVAGAIVLGSGLGGYSLWVEPALRSRDLLTKQIAQYQADLATAATQTQELRVRATDPDAANRKALQEARDKLLVLDQEVKSYQGMLVPPDQAARLLQSLLARHRGLELVSLETLPPTSLVAPVEKADEPKGDAKAAAAPKAARPASPGGNIYKHGIDIRVAGSFNDLLAWLGELEQGPQKLIWGQMNLAAQTYPRSVLTLRVYTLSLDSTWLVL
ncbi:MAG TPA: type II secretion system protein GspM [Rhodocyclaceae bacterium]